MKTKCAKTLAVLTASLLSLSVAGQAAAKEKESKPKQEPTPKQESTPKKKQSSPTRTTNQIDLRSKLASMHLHDGLNLVHSGDGVKLMAEARNNKIVGWSATDDKGNKLPTTVKKDSAGQKIIIARLDNDPSLPEHGSLKITIRGGK